MLKNPAFETTVNRRDTGQFGFKENLSPEIDLPDGAGFPNTGPLYDAIAERIATDPTTPAAELETLAGNDNLWRTEAAIARHENTPESVQLRYARSPENSTVNAIAGRSDVPAAILSVVAEHPLRDIRATAAANPNLGPGTANMLAADPDIQVQLALCANPNIMGHDVAVAHLRQSQYLKVRETIGG